MDKFNLREYISNNPLLKEEAPKFKGSNTFIEDNPYFEADEIPSSIDHFEISTVIQAIGASNTPEEFFKTLFPKEAGFSMFPSEDIKKFFSYHKPNLKNNPLLKEVSGPPEGDPYDGPWDETGDTEPSLDNLERDVPDISEKGRQLTVDEVNALYDEFPEIEDPYYEGKEEIDSDEYGETATFKITVYEDYETYGAGERVKGVYEVFSDSMGDDDWWEWGDDHYKDRNLDEIKIRPDTKKEIFKKVKWEIRNLFPTFKDAPDHLDMDIKQIMKEIEKELTGSVEIDDYTNMIIDEMTKWYKKEGILQENKTPLNEDSGLLGPGGTFDKIDRDIKGLDDDDKLEYLKNVISYCGEIEVDIQYEKEMQKAKYNERI